MTKAVPPVSPAFVAAVAAALRDGAVRDKDGLHRLKQALAREHGVLPRDSDLIAALPPDVAGRHMALLRKKPMRTGSGVAVVAVMSSPAACPHGKCIYCPGGPEVDAPQSYTGFEPSTMRAKRFDYDAYRIVRNRLGQLDRNGHTVDKVDVVVQGGTFPARDAAYRDWFVAGIYTGCNDGPGPDGGDTFDGLADWEAMTPAERDGRLAAAMRANEDARCRVIGLTIETKPDWCLEPHLDDMLRYGATRIELGIQTLDEGVLRATNRGHTLEDSRRAMRLARDAGFKVCVHTMPGLPGNTPESDIAEADTLFRDPDWRPDMMKIYPTLVVEEGETTLKRWWREGRYEPYDTGTATRVVAAQKRFVPEYCRIQRIDRDIPTTHVLGGVQNSNLRQLAQTEMQRQGWPACRCIRCREVHRRAAEGVEVHPDRVVLVRRDYEASGGTEVFLSLEDPEADAVVAFLRLRRVGPEPHRSEFRHPDGAAVVRELKVYGTAQAVGDDPETGAWQHRGHGTRLLAEAERIAFGEWGVGRTLVIAGVGVKGYYRRRGYTDLGPYVARE